MVLSMDVWISVQYKAKPNQSSPLEMKKIYTNAS